MAFEPLPAGDWRTATLAAARHAGLEAQEQGQGIVAWSEVQQSRWFDYADGWNLRREWLGPRRHAVCLLARRLYFDKSTGDLDRRPEHEITGGRRPPGPPSSQQIKGQWDVLMSMIDHLGADAHHPLVLQTVRDDIGDLRVMAIGDVERAEPNASLASVYRELGFDCIPRDFTVTVCRVDGVSEEVAAEFSTRLTNAAQVTRTPLRVSETSVGAVEHRLQEVRQTEATPTPGRCLVFLMPPKNQPHSSATLQLLRDLETAGVPFRRAYADDPFQFSTPGQLPSILLAAGGRPHRSPQENCRAPLWTVGVDLGHPLGVDTSRLAMTLVDPNGGLDGAWYLHQRRDETARSESLSRLLRKCSERLAELDSQPRVLVLRDGRTFENERADLYARFLGDDLTFVEFRKRHNPQMLQDDSTQRVPSRPIAAVVPNTSTMILTTICARDARKLPPVVKVVARPEANGLNLQPADIAEAITRAAAAPSLGTWPHHLPAAIYWADGIAGKSDTDLRFWGTPAVCLD